MKAWAFVVLLFLGYCLWQLARTWKYRDGFHRGVWITILCLGFYWRVDTLGEPGGVP